MWFYKEVMMQVSYNKLWKILIDRGMSTAELRKKADFAPNTLTKLKQNQPVALTLLAKICAVLNTDIGHIMSFVPEEIKEEKVVSKNSLDYFNISKALSMEFSSVYHVNTNTDEYVKYESDPGKELKNITYKKDGKSISSIREYDSKTGRLLNVSFYKPDKNELSSVIEYDEFGQSRFTLYADDGEIITQEF